MLSRIICLFILVIQEESRFHVDSKLKYPEDCLGNQNLQPNCNKSSVAFPCPISTLVINLDRITERCHRIHNQFSKLNVNVARFNAIDGIIVRNRIMEGLHDSSHHMYSPLQIKVVIHFIHVILFVS